MMKNPFGGGGVPPPLGLDRAKLNRCTETIAGPETLMKSDTQMSFGRLHGAAKENEGVWNLICLIRSFFGL